MTDIAEPLPLLDRLSVDGDRFGAEMLEVVALFAKLRPGSGKLVVQKDYLLTPLFEMLGQVDLFMGQDLFPLDHPLFALH